MVDQRDDLTWVAVELSHVGEQKVVENTLERSLRRDLEVDEDHPMFIPCTLFQRGGRVVTIHLMEGYVFIASGLPETKYFSLERQPYVNQVMSTMGSHRMRVVSVITDAHVQRMRAELRRISCAEIPLGAEVRVTEGTYRNLTGMVTGIDGDSAFILICLRSLDVVATVPRIFLDDQTGS